MGFQVRKQCIFTIACREIILYILDSAKLCMYIIICTVYLVLLRYLDVIGRYNVLNISQYLCTCTCKKLCTICILKHVTFSYIYMYTYKFVRATYQICKNKCTTALYWYVYHLQVRSIYKDEFLL